MDEGSEDLVAVWEVHLADGVHLIEFEHGTTSGKRVLKVDRQVLFKRDWMFKLVGTENFTVGKNNTQCTILIEPVGGFTYQYSLEVRIVYQAWSLSQLAGGWEIIEEVY